MENSVTTSRAYASKSVVPFFYLNTYIPSYSGKEPLKKTFLTTHQKRALHYIHLLESENPIPILSELTQKNLYFHTNYAFYADPICTGKSFVILSLLSLHPCVERKQLLTIWSNGLGMNVFSKIENFEIPLSLLVVPHSSISQWNILLQEETNIKYFIVDSEVLIDSINTSENEVLLVADNVFDKLCQHFEGFCVSRIIFDDLLNLEIKHNMSSQDPSLFGNLRASFTWFVCSEPEMCLQKYKNSRLPFATLIKQMFSFPHPGLIFRNEFECLQQSLSSIVPKINISYTNVYLENLNSELKIEDEIYDIFQSKNIYQNYQHLISLLVFRLNLSFFSIQEYINSQNLSCEKIQTLNERYQSQIDPITYEKIKYPILLPCCHQIYDLITLSRCFLNDQRCPFCREVCSWSDMIALDKSSYHLNMYIFDFLKNVDLNKYNIFYIPSLSKEIKVSNYSKEKINRFIRETFKNYKSFLWNGKANSKKTFEDFKKEKGILFITKPIQSNLHLSFIDELYVLHPKEYTCQNTEVWYTNHFKKCYNLFISPWENRDNFPLSDLELGNFCIGRKTLLNIKFLSFL